MRLPEQRFWDRARRALSPYLHIERVENVLSDGMPDVWVLAPSGLVTPVELKAVVGLPARHTTRVLGAAGLRQSQKNWHMTWRQHGGRSAYLIGVGGDRQLLIPGRYHDELNDWTYSHMVTASVARDWPGIVAALNEGWKI